MATQGLDESLVRIGSLTEEHEKTLNKPFRTPDGPKK